MNIAIVLSGGTGKRMGGNIPKQYMMLEGRPILFYSLKTFEDSFIDYVIIVAGSDYIDYCQTEIVNKYQLSKVVKIVEGGAERYHSVWEGIKAAADYIKTDEENYIYIHDGARACIDNDSLDRLKESVEVNKACVAAMPVKDTIKIVDEDGFAKDTPARKYLWNVQTPQVFEYELIREAYRRYMEEDGESLFAATDDAMMVERLTDRKVKLVEASYYNIKITTPEDMEISRVFLTSKL